MWQLTFFVIRYKWNYPLFLCIAATGWFFVRAIAMVFDRYLQADRNRARFSKII